MPGTSDGGRKAAVTMRLRYGHNVFEINGRKAAGIPKTRRKKYVAVVLEDGRTALVDPGALKPQV